MFVKRQLETRGKETLLLVEDEPALRSMAAQALRQQGYAVLEAANGRQALEIWERSGRKIDLLFTDVIMPRRLSGVELARRLRKERPSLRTLFSSGYSTELMQEDLLIMEGVNFLQKPYDIRELIGTVRRCLDAVEVPQGTVLPADYEPAGLPNPRGAEAENSSQ